MLKMFVKRPCSKRFSQFVYIVKIYFTYASRTYALENDEDLDDSWTVSPRQSPPRRKMEKNLTHFKSFP